MAEHFCIMANSNVRLHKSAQKSTYILLLEKEMY